MGTRPGCQLAGDSRSIADLTAKVVDYLKAGAQLVWVLDPQARKVLVHTPTGPVRILSVEGGEAPLRR